MKTIRFLHISDLHRGGPWQNDVVGDHRDSAVSKDFAVTITSPMETDFIDAIKHWQGFHGKIDAIVCTGDLGDKGNTKKIEEGVSFIQLIQRELSISPDHVLICPGNHDADRKKSHDQVFLGFTSALSSYGFKDHLPDTEPVVINGIPFIVVNTSLGASEKSVFIQKYKELINGLDSDEQSLFAEELKAVGMEYLDDCLDIPAVTNSQGDRVINAIMKDEASFVVLVMHHNLIPCNSVEIRPYSSVIDAGKTLDRLMGTQKDVLILHGHVHFPTASIFCRPQEISFVSSVGSGLFNGTSGSSINIIEVFCSDEGDHVITVVYEFIKQINGLNFNKSFSLYHQSGKEDLAEIIKLFEVDPEKGIRFSDMKGKVNCSERELLRVILSQSNFFKVSRNKSNDVKDWIIHRK